MKNIIYACVLVLIGAGSSFGAASSASVLADAGKTVVSGSSTIGKLSTGVHLSWNTAAAGYAVITAHKSGVKAFGSAHDSTAITWKTQAKDTVVDVPSAAGSAAVSGAGWTIM